jgi:hypothetical protein
MTELFAAVGRRAFFFEQVAVAAAVGTVAVAVAVASAVAAVAAGNCRPSWDPHVHAQSVSPPPLTRHFGAPFMSILLVGDTVVPFRGMRRANPLFYCLRQYHE